MRKRFTARHLAAAAWAAAFLVHTAGAQAGLRVPAVAGPPVLVDGRFSPGEWAGARAVPIASGDTLLLRQAQGHVFIGVRTARPYPTYVDIFLQDGERRVYNLHASMQTGERELTDTLWTDTRPATRWGNENGWIANVSKRVPERLQDRTMPAPKEFFFPSEGREFQLLRSRFRGDRWSVRVEVRDLGGGGAPDVVYPARSSRDEPAGWAVLDLGTPAGASVPAPVAGTPPATAQPASRVFAAIYRRGRAYVHERTIYQQPALAEHVRHHEALGPRLIAAGALRAASEDPVVGLIVFEAADAAKAEEWFRRDPAVVAGVLTGEVRQWGLRNIRAYPAP